MNQRFAKSRFLAASEDERQILCEALAEELARRILSSSAFHDDVWHAVQALRALGHDLWSFDESDEFSLWCPNYATPTGPGIVVTFRPDAVEVEWVQR